LEPPDNVTDPALSGLMEAAYVFRHRNQLHSNAAIGGAALASLCYSCISVDRPSEKLAYAIIVHAKAARSGGKVTGHADVTPELCLFVAD
jgi:hypothetical protein